MCSYPLCVVLIALYVRSSRFKMLLGPCEEGSGPKLILPPVEALTLRLQVIRKNVLVNVCPQVLTFFKRWLARAPCKRFIVIALV